MGKALSKKERHIFILDEIRKNPFLKDDELARECNVSVSTIRIDRGELGISEYRERVKKAAWKSRRNTEKVLDINLFHNGVSILKVDSSMLFENTDIVKSQYIYAFAENLALSVINAKAALVKVANVKYVHEVHSSDTLVAHSEVIRDKENEYIVHVFIKVDKCEVFRGKFSLLVTAD